MQIKFALFVLSLILLFPLAIAGNAGDPCNYLSNGDSECNVSANIYCEDYTCKYVADPSTYCSDSDGTNQYTKTTVNYRYRDYSGRFMSGSSYDECLQGNLFVSNCSAGDCKVREVFCKQNPPAGSLLHDFQNISCANGCNNGACYRPAHCSNGTKDSDEAGIDCGGADCAACQQQPSQSGQPGANCTNGIRDYDETGVDCGGAYCQPCQASQPALTDHCKNGVKDADEAYIDCGGNDCGRCTHCDDRRKNENESDTDCGGPDCKKCPLRRNCYSHSDCESGYCNEGSICAESSCNDGIKNGTEEGIDCGGPCEAECQEIIDDLKLLEYINKWANGELAAAAEENDAKILEIIENWKNS